MNKNLTNIKKFATNVIGAGVMLYYNIKKMFGYGCKLNWFANITKHYAFILFYFATIRYTDATKHVKNMKTQLKRYFFKTRANFG